MFCCFLLFCTLYGDTLFPFICSAFSPTGFFARKRYLTRSAIDFVYWLCRPLSCLSACCHVGHYFVYRPELPCWPCSVYRPCRLLHRHHGCLQRQSRGPRCSILLGSTILLGLWHLENSRCEGRWLNITAALSRSQGLMLSFIPSRCSKCARSANNGNFSSSVSNQATFSFFTPPKARSGLRPSLTRLQYMPSIQSCHLFSLAIYYLFLVTSIAPAIYALCLYLYL